MSLISATLCKTFCTIIDTQYAIHFEKQPGKWKIFDSKATDQMIKNGYKMVIGFGCSTLNSFRKNTDDVSEKKPPPETGNKPPSQDLKT